MFRPSVDGMFLAYSHLKRTDTWHPGIHRCIVLSFRDVELILALGLIYSVRNTFWKKLGMSSLIEDGLSFLLPWTSCGQSNSPPRSSNDTAYGSNMYPHKEAVRWFPSQDARRSRIFRLASSPFTRTMVSSAIFDA